MSTYTCQNRNGKTRDQINQEASDPKDRRLEEEVLDAESEYDAVGGRSARQYQKETLDEGEDLSRKDTAIA